MPWLRLCVCVCVCVVQCPVDSVVEMDKDREYPFQEYKVRHTQPCPSPPLWCSRCSHLPGRGVVPVGVPTGL